MPTATPSSWFERRPAQALVAVALILVMCDATFLYKHRWLLPNYTGMSWDTATLLTSGEGYSFLDQAYFPFAGPGNKVSAAREPVPVLLFAAVQTIKPGSHLALGALQAAAHLATMAGIFFLTRRFGTVHAALLASLCWTFYPAAIRELLGKEVDLLAAVFVVWGLVFFLRALDDRHWSSMALAATFLGLAALTRSALLAVVLALAAGLAFAKMPRRLIVVFVSVFLLTQLPWMIRNAIVFGQPVVGTTLTGYNFYRQNCLIGDGSFFRYLAGSDADEAFSALLAAHPELKGTENEAQMDAFYRREALTIIAQHPLRYAALAGFRFFILWFNLTVPEAYGNSVNASDYLLMIQHALLLTLALTAGLGSMWKQAWPIVVGVGAFTLIHMGVAGRMYYTIDVVPLLLPVASHYAVSAATRYRWIRMTVPTAIALCAVYIVLVVYGKFPLPNP